MVPDGDFRPDGTLVTEAPVDFPEVLDLVVVGGGPCGTACAFRAKELGLTALVIELDDLMKRIRDYAKDKLILPNFGGGDRMKFPAGGDRVQSLYFKGIDKDEMCLAWKALYRRHNVPAQVGIELTGLERGQEHWRIKVWNHHAKGEEMLLARSVALGIGRGVPRRFDIPGNTDGIAFRLNEATTYVGAPACVIGGGTSAAEAVIAISNAKAGAGDPTAVYWSYRGSKMPKVSRALAEVFFDAYVGNGNILYHPHSEPVAVVAGEDRQDYLAVRVDRRALEDRPHETTHLEFQKTQCIASIGEDIPEAFLAGLGIPMAVGGPRNKKRMVVSPLLETCQPGVFLMGDILSQAYLKTDDFDADPATFEEVRHRGNIKAAMRDGVLIAEVVRQRLDGHQPASLEVADAPTLVEAEEATERTAVGLQPLESSGPPAVAASEDDAAGWLVRLVADGSVEGDEHRLPPDGQLTLGRQGCDLNFAGDTLLSDQHATVSHATDGVFVQDLGSRTGVFAKVPAGGSWMLTPGHVVQIGQQFLLLRGQGEEASWEHFDHTGAPQGKQPIPSGTTVVGRQAPGWSLAPDDQQLSRRHIAVTRDAGGLRLKDLNTVNGTFVRIREPLRLTDGLVFRVGRQLFAFSDRLEQAVAVTLLQSTTGTSVTTAVPGAPAPAAAVPEAGGATVTFHGTGESLPLAPGQTICELAEAHGIPIQSECHAGICGTDPLRIVEGAEHLTPLTDAEREALEDVCDLEPGPHRLACVLSASGPVTVEIL